MIAILLIVVIIAILLIVVIVAILLIVVIIAILRPPHYKLACPHSALYVNGLHHLDVDITYLCKLSTLTYTILNLFASSQRRNKRNDLLFCKLSGLGLRPWVLPMFKSIGALRNDLLFCKLSGLCLRPWVSPMFTIID